METENLKKHHYYTNYYLSRDGILYERHMDSHCLSCDGNGYVLCFSCKALNLPGLCEKCEDDCSACKGQGAGGSNDTYYEALWDADEVFVGRDGYWQAYLYRGKKKTRHPKKIHVLMADVWLPPRPSKQHLIRHLDGNSLNNAASNLAWGTHEENMQDLRKHREERAPLTNELKSEIIKALGRRNRSVDTRKEIADNFNVAFSTVNRLYWKIKDEKAT